MQCKIFSSPSCSELEKQVNKWLTQNPCQVTHVQFAPYSSDFPFMLVLFYVPMQPL